MIDPIVIVGAARTPMGGFQGDLTALTAAQAWAHAAADLRADAERELAAMAVRVERIGKALEVE